MKTSNDWVLVLSFATTQFSVELAQEWESQLKQFDASVSRWPDRGLTDVTLYRSGDLQSVISETLRLAATVVGAEAVGVDVVTEAEHMRRAEEPTIPELMSAAEIADELGVTRQRVHQLRSTAAFPAPLAELRGGAVWDARAVRRFGETWERKPGKPARQPAVVESKDVSGVRVAAVTRRSKTRRQERVAVKKAVRRAVRRASTG